MANVYWPINHSQWAKETFARLKLAFNNDPVLNEGWFVDVAELVMELEQYTENYALARGMTAELENMVFTAKG